MQAATQEWLDAQYLFTLGKSRPGKRRRAGFEEELELEKRVKEFTRDNCTYCNDSRLINVNPNEKG